MGTTLTISVGQSINSSIDYLGDHDWYAINLTAGQAVDVTVTGITLADPYLNIMNSSGTIIYSNDDIVDGVNRNSEVKFSPTYTGTYYIDASAWKDPNAPADGYTGTGTYTVAVQPYTPPPLGTNDQIAQELISGYWGGDVHHWNVKQGGTLTVDIHTLTTAEQTLALAALQEWTDIIGVNFAQVTSGAQIVFSDGGDTTGKSPVAQTNANWSNGITTSANVDISSSWVTSYGSTLDSYSFQTYIHEIGHALGLGHSGNYNETARYPYDATFQNDSWATSIMSYFSQTDNTYFGNKGFSQVYAVTPMPADILAMQQLYGLSTTTRTGDTIYGDHSNAGGIYNAQLYPDVAYTIYDSGGNNTIDYSLSSANQVINLNPETFSNVDGYVGNLEIARGVLVQTAIGGSGNDTLIANSANDVLTGGPGADTLQGGAGNDTFKDTEANHSGDTITNFHPGDVILFTDATPGSFTFSLSGNTLTYTGGSMTINGVIGDKFTASAAASGGVQLTEAHAVANDFNGNGSSDILWRNDSGYLTDWLSTANGGFVSNNINAGSGAVDNNWKIAGVGDFNGDGHSDILWQNSTTGAVTEWLGTSNGGFTSNQAIAGSNGLGSGWQIAGVGDFNGDGISDVLWRNTTTGYVTEWLGTSNGSFVTNNAAGTGAAGTGWQIVGTGDFNGDGISDILWRNTATGYLTEWLGTNSGSFAPNSGAGTGAADNSWQIVGTGDFNGDGISDILWRNTTSGYVTEWLGTSSGSFTPNPSAGTGAADPGWQIVGIGDFNADGHSDILWRNTTTGYVTEWLGTTNGSFISNQANAGTGAADTSWHVQDTLFG